MLSPNPSTAASSVLLFLLPAFATAISLDCTDVRDNGVRFNFKPLDGPHTIYQIKDHPNTFQNTSFTIDLCKPLKRGGNDVPRADDCPGGSRVCAVERTTNVVDDTTIYTNMWPIAGEYSHSTGGAMDPKLTRLRSSESPSDREKEGVRITMNGGKHEKQRQKASVELLCQRDEQGDKVRRKAEDAKEDDDDDDDEGEGKNKAHDHTGEKQSDGHGGTLKLVSWDVEEDDVKVLRLEWMTKYACEDADGSDGGSSSSGSWGFFTWLLIILFMGVAAYLIFGSWLNYNRYSARGWDVLPHSDTIQDLPYLFRDWMRRVINTVQGGGSRGGYSAV